MTVVTKVCATIKKNIYLFRLNIYVYIYIGFKLFKYLNESYKTNFIFSNNANENTYLLYSGLHHFHVVFFRL